MLLALLILTVCSLGRMQYTILENGQILPGFVSSKKTIMFSLGYSISNSIMSAIAVGMLIYSIILVSIIKLITYIYHYAHFNDDDQF